jgi:protein required for attachment to host cells
MLNTWVIAADASRARIFEVLGNKQVVNEIEAFVHRDSREYDRELVSDAQGRAHGGMIGHSMAPRTDPSEHEADVFSHSIAEYLEKARVEHRYDKLQLIAPPKFLGMLRKHLSKDAQRLVARETPKDISWFDSGDVERYIREAE